MSRELSVIYFCLLFGLVFTYGESEGDSCYYAGQTSQCTLISKCMQTYKGQWWKLPICGFVGVPRDVEPIVCCPAVATTTTSTSTTTPRPVATPPPQPYKQTTTEYIPEYDYDTAIERAPDCPPLDANRTTPPQNIKSWDRCLDYQLQAVYPCEESFFLMGEKVRKNNCHHIVDDHLIIGGVGAMRNEFPHMALLGYGQFNGTAVWSCGGTIISDRFILTAAHCTRVRILGYVNYAIVGSLRRTDDVDASQVHRIISRVKHPNYRPITRHNDIALLKTETKIQFSRSVVPACLDVFGDDQARAVATGWGATTQDGVVANTLEKVTLTKFTDSECRDKYPINRHGAVYNATTQVCYGDYERSAESCQGDSGGPLTVLNHRLHCMYTVVAVTSFGMRCGTIGLPGYYTRVAHYVPWIESIVWP